MDAKALGWRNPKIGRVYAQCHNAERVAATVQPQLVERESVVKRGG